MVRLVADLFSNMSQKAYENEKSLVGDCLLALDHLCMNNKETTSLLCSDNNLILTLNSNVLKDGIDLKDNDISDDIMYFNGIKLL